MEDTMRITTILVAAAATIGSTMISATTVSAMPVQHGTSYGAPSGLVEQAAYYGGTSYSVTRSYHRPYYPRRTRYITRRIYQTPGYSTRVLTRPVYSPRLSYRRLVLRRTYSTPHSYG